MTNNRACAAPVRRANPQRVKLHRIYSTTELATCCGVHKNTVRHWQAKGLEAISTGRPILFKGMTVHFEINGLVEPKSVEAQRICQEDLNEVITQFVQDKTNLEQGMFNEEAIPQELTQLRMGKIVRDRYPELSADDQEAVRQHAVAALNLTQKAKLIASGGNTSGDATGGANGGSDDAKANTALIDGVRRFAMDALLAELGIEATGEDDIRVLRHVQSAEERRAAEEIANRTKCEDFGKFKPLFAEVERDFDTGARTTRPFVKDAGFLKSDITEGQFFILGGQIAYVAEVGEPFRAPNGESDARLRVIYSNGTESDLLRRSLQRALYKDEAGRRITEIEAGPLFSGETEDADLASGTIYVLRSKSDHPMVAEHRDLIHKIGVTGGSVETRIAGAEKSATYLLARVEIVATYKLFNINRAQLEAVIHKVFAAAALDLTIPDRFGNPVKPREWFLVPLSVIDEAVSRIRDGSITGFRYDPLEARLVAD